MLENNEPIQKNTLRNNNKNKFDFHKIFIADSSQICRSISLVEIHLVETHLNAHDIFLISRCF